MTKGRYSTFKESSIRGSWTIGRITQRLASNWLVECCCGSCYARQKAASRSESNETYRKENLASINELQTPSIDSVKSKHDGQLTEEIPLTKRDYGVSKDDEFLTLSVNKQETSFANHKDDSSIGTSNLKSKSSFGSGTLSGGMKRVIGSLPVLPKKEKKSPSVNDEKKASQSDSELGYPASIFARCPNRYVQQNVSTINISELTTS